MSKLGEFLSRAIYGGKSTGGDAPPRISKRARLTGANSGKSPVANSFMYFVRPAGNETWRVQDLDSDTLSKVTPQKLIEILTDLSPEVSRALFDFIRMFNSGWTVTAYVPGTDVQSKAGQKIIDDFLDTLRDLYGGVDIVLGRLIIGGWLRGAFFAELVLDESGRRAVDLATPDPYGAKFKRVIDPVRGDTWELGQKQGNKWVSFANEITVKYIPIDPLPNSPYGRSLVQPAIFVSLFLLGLMHDMRRVVSQQGYPRLDVEIKLQELRESMPASVANEPDEFRAWVNAVIDEVESVYRDLQPEDVYIHTDTIKVNRPVGTLDSSSLGAVDGLIRAIERMTIRALKTMPLMMAVNEATSETHANRQWEIQAAGIKSLQHLLEGLLEHLLAVATRAAGVRATVKWRFAELRASEMLRDAQTESARIQNARAKYAAGWVSQDAAALEITGTPADVPEPRDTGGVFGVPPVSPNDGAMRTPRKWGDVLDVMARAVQFSPNGSEDDLPPEPDTVTVSEDDTAWDDIMPPEFRGMLDAVVTGE